MRIRKALQALAAIVAASCVHAAQSAPGVADAPGPTTAAPATLAQTATPVVGSKTIRHLLSPASLANKRVLWLGDSITQMGGYVTDVQYALDRLYPAQNFDIVSVGLASETASGLSEKRHPFPRPDIHERLQRALDKVKPDVVVACYGMNDGIYHPQSPDRLAAFEKGIQSVIDIVHASGARVILLTPPPFDAQAAHNLEKVDAPDFSFMDPYSGYDDVLTDYATWELSLNEPGLDVIDLHTPTLNFRTLARQTIPTYHDTGDGIHPDPIGQLVMARAFLRGIDTPLPGDDTLPELTAEQAAMNADPVYGLVAKQRETRSNGWLPYIGYTRGKTFTATDIAPTETAVAALQTQIDALRPPIKVACVGDSITFGAGVANRDVNSYPAVLGRWLGLQYDVVNFGVSGATLLKHGDKPYWTQKAFPASISFAPNVVVVMLGANDTKPQNWKYGDEFSGDYKALVDQYAALPTKPKIYVCLPVPVTGAGNYGINEAGVDLEIPEIDALAAAESATVIDVHAALTGHDDLIPDHVHPNAAGAKLIAAAVYQSLTSKAPPADVAAGP